MRRTPRTRIVAVVALFTLMIAVPAGIVSPARAEETATLDVFAAASLSEVFGEIGTMFERGHPGTKVRFNFAGSQQLAAQIEQGAHADLFASADQRWMRWLGERRLIDGEPSVFAHNHLVVIVPRSNPGRVGRLQDLARRGVKVVIAGASVPAGAYSRDMLKRLAGMPGFGEDYGARVLANVVSEEENVKAVAFKVQIGEGDAGIVYRSDVNAASSRYLQFYEIPAAANPVADYPIALVHGSAHADIARAFIALLGSAAGRGVLVRYQFIPPTP